MARSGFSSYGLVYWRQVILGRLGLGLLFATWPIFGTTKPVKKRAANSNLELQFWVVYLFFFWGLGNESDSR
jgi:hypothetical protein